MAIKNDYWIIGEKEEVEKFERKVDFKKDTIGISYNLLIPEFQQCVNETIRSLSDGKENFGYNLEKLIKLYKSAEPSISQLSICRQLLEDAEGFMSEEEAYDFSLNGDVGLSKRLDALKKDKIQKHTQNFINLYKICVIIFLLILICLKGELEKFI